MHREVPRQRQSDAVAHQPQHADRGHLDRRAGRHPLFLAVPSFQLLTAQYTPPEEAEADLKATGNQWNWDYEYQVEEPLSFNSAMLPDADRAAAGKEDRAVYPRLLAVDNELVVPVNTMVRVLVTAADVIHAFAMPAFGVKTDAVPGRINEIWFKADKEGLYYGQCSELCGKDHAFMPIAIRVVTDAQYKTWLAAAKTDLAGANKALMAAIDGAAQGRGRRQLTTGGQRSGNGAEHGRRDSSSRRPRPQAVSRLGPLGLLDQPQGHRHALPDLRDHARASSAALLSVVMRMELQEPGIQIFTAWPRWSTASTATPRSTAASTCTTSSPPRTR